MPRHESHNNFSQGEGKKQRVCNRITPERSFSIAKITRKHECRTAVAGHLVFWEMPSGAPFAFNIWMRWFLSGPFHGEKTPEDRNNHAKGAAIRCSRCFHRSRQRGLQNTGRLGYAANCGSLRRLPGRKAPPGSQIFGLAWPIRYAVFATANPE